MGSVIAAGHMALKSKYKIQLTGLLGVVVLLAQLGVVGLSEGLEDAAQPAHDGGPHVPVGLLVGDEVNGSLAGQVPAAHPPWPRSARRRAARHSARSASAPEAAPDSHERHVASLAQIERELYEVEEQLVSKKIAERLPVSLAAKSATLAALERVEKARKELDEASRELLTALNLQGSSTDSL